MSATLSQTQAFNVSISHHALRFATWMFFVRFAILMAMPWSFKGHLDAYKVLSRVSFDLICTMCVFSYNGINRRLKAKIAEAGADSAFLVSIRAKLVSLMPSCRSSEF